METFYIIVLSVAIVFLILILTFFGVLMTRTNLVVYPPVANVCPDKWEPATDGSSCIIPDADGANVGNIYVSAGTFAPTFTKYTPGISGYMNGLTDVSFINFGDAGWTSNSNYTGLTSICAQQKWTNQFGINWDGVSNYNSC